MKDCLDSWLGLFKFSANFCLESNRFARVFVASRSIFKQSFDSLALFDISMADSLAKNPDDSFPNTTKSFCGFDQATQLNEARNSTQHDRKLFVLVPEPPVYWTSIRQADADPSLTGFSFSYNYS